MNCVFNRRKEEEEDEMLFRMGIDTGGTFTDFVVADEAGEFRMYKSPTTPHDCSVGIIN